MMDIIRELVKAADTLDRMGFIKEAGVVDELIQKYARVGGASHLLQSEEDLFKAIEGLNKMGAVNIKILVRAVELPKDPGGKTFIQYEMQVKMPNEQKIMTMMGTLHTPSYDDLNEKLMKKRVSVQGLEDIDDPYYGLKEKSEPLAKKYPSGGNVFRPPAGEAQAKPMGGQRGIGIAYD